MKKSIKFLSVFLSICMLLALLPAVSLADGEKIYAAYNSEDYSLTFFMGKTVGGSVVRGATDAPVAGDAFYTDFADDPFYYYDEDDYYLTPWYNHAADIKIVRFLDEIAPTYTAAWFYNCENLEGIIGLEKLNTEAVYSMMGMFYNCQKLASIDVSHFDTANVQDMTGMFALCTALTALDVSGFDTSQVSSMTAMFAMCTRLAELDIFETRGVESVLNMFLGCSALTSLDLSDFDMGNVSELLNMFRDCNSLSSLQLGPNFRFSAEYSSGSPDLPEPSADGPYTGNWIRVGDETGSTYTSQVLMASYDGETMAGLWVWEGTSPIPTDLSGAAVTVADQVYTGAALRPAVTVTLNGTDLVEGTDYTVKYKNNKAIGTATVTVKGKGAYFGKATQTFAITAPAGQYAVFNEDGENQTLTYCVGTPNGNTVTRANNETVSGTDVMHITANLYAYTSAKKVIFLDPFEVTMCHETFSGCSDLTEIEGIGYLNTAQVTTMGAMFEGCSSLTSLDLSSFSTGNVDDMGQMFDGCSSLTSLVLSGFDTANVTDMGSMFNGCSSLASLDLSSFSTANVNYMNGMFSDCNALSSLTLGPNFRFHVGDSYADLPDVTQTAVYTGKWVLSGGDGTTYTSAELMDAYDGSAAMVGRWVWETRADISDAAVTVAPQTYTGEEVRPSVTVKLNGRTLTEGTDYFVAYANNTEIGTATVTVTGIGTYCGTVTKTFAITASEGDPNTDPNTDPDEEPGSSSNPFLEFIEIIKQLIKKIVEALRTFC